MRPSGIAVYRLSKTRNSIVPMTISGVDSGISISRFEPRATGPRQRDSPSASATPSGTAIAIVSRASTTLFHIACLRSGSWASELVGSSHHQRNEKPCHVLRERPELNENWMAISTGTIAQQMNSHVNVARNTGRRHGFSNQVRTLHAHVPRGAVDRAQVART